ncbi:MAG TPA: TldD/PmbA family protein [Gemmatimonadaceae bacterium]|nr:TldD/PmbA family protein [Gemmatimonadaceae bacterium]
MRPRSLYDSGSAPLSREEAQALTKRALSFSKADQARVTINDTAQGNTRFAVNQVSTSGDATDTVVTVQSVFGKRAASASTNKLDDASLKQTVDIAERLAKLSPENQELMPELGAQTYLDVDGWTASTANLDPAGRAAAVRKVTGPSQQSSLVATGFIEADADVAAIATSAGLFAYGRLTSSSMTTTVRTADGTGSGWAGASHSDWSKIDASALGQHAMDKALRSRDAVAIEPGRYTVVLEPTAVGNLIQLLGFAMNARNADEGRSFFTKPGGGNKIGLKVVDERVTLTSDPADPDTKALAFAPDGLAVKPTTWIRNGVVQTLAYDRYWAQKQGKEPTPFIRAVRMSGGTGGVEDLVASTERGILVTRLWYIRSVDQRTILVTGLTRDGTFLIENGKVTKAVKNFRFNESPIFLLNNLEAMGEPVRVSASEDGGPGIAIVVPPIKAHDFNFTSLSDAI